MAESTTRRGPGLNRIALYVALLLMVVVYLSPLESGIVTAFKTQQGFFETSPFAPALGEFTVDPWFNAFDRLRSGLVNSLLFTIPATVLSALFGSLAAYGLTNTDWKGQTFVLMLFIAGIFIPYQSVLVPLSQFWATIVNPAEILAFSDPLANRSGLIALMVTHSAYGIPICTLLFRSHYKSIDTSMLEAARLDGAGIAKIYWRIILPLSIPMFVVTLIYQFTNIWNDLLFALVLVGNPANDVVTMELSALQGSMVGQYNLQMAGAFITALPTLLVYIIFGEQFAEGVAGGGA
ncbi:carbohydrate ABC transporter permease [Halapricum desulfuricans]|uniref:ABC-type sugar transport system, permease component n=1 Tax=Halapricum desulfuricans TaxID=2841257 RepID=A0A897NVH7_9EURY|nr:carbohydrate ABC transporter permease [Halapricum desulfuricans]QSG16241.1 ABC-type sugar transport system, permease component [Halapricum desulfuricans]